MTQIIIKNGNETKIIIDDVFYKKIKTFFNVIKKQKQFAVTGEYFFGETIKEMIFLKSKYYSEILLNGENLCYYKIFKEKSTFIFEKIKNDNTRFIDFDQVIDDFKIKKDSDFVFNFKKNKKDFFVESFCSLVLATKRIIDFKSIENLKPVNCWEVFFSENNNSVLLFSNNSIFYFLLTD